MISRVLAHCADEMEILPRASLVAASNCNARVKGGTRGAKDLTGKALALIKTWTFTTR